MIENKELPSEYVSIRSVWLRGIEDCRRAISQIANLEASSDMKYDLKSAPRTIYHTVEALYLSLVDYGEATVLSDVDIWREKTYIPENNKIWDTKTKKEKHTVTFAGMEVDEEEEKKEEEKKLSVDEKWWAQSKLSQRLYKQIIQVLNKYGMLFPEQPKGFSNTIMEEVE